MSTLLRTTFLLALSGILVGVATGQTPTTTIQNGNADTRLQLNYDGGLLVPGSFGPTTPADSIPAIGAGTRLMWYPAKAAFRAGRVGFYRDGTQWDAAKVGDYSVAFGLDTEASGNTATAMGQETTASGGVSTTMGYATIASGIGAVAMGNQTTAGGSQALAMGSNASASGSQSIAMGQQTVASGNDGMAIGQLAKAANDNTFVWNDGGQYHDFDSDGTLDGLSSAQRVASSDPSGYDTFSVGATGGVRFVTGSDKVTYISSGSAGWSNTSTRAAKTDVRRVDPASVLTAVRTMPVSTWEYTDGKGDGQGTRHIGPMAEDFHGELPYDLGNSDDHINSINADGVALAAIKGLTERVTTQRQHIAELRAEKNTLDAEHDEIKARLAALEADRSPSTTAGWTGSSGGHLLSFLLGGLLGAGLLWRRRASNAD